MILDSEIGTRVNFHEKWQKLAKSCMSIFIINLKNIPALYHNHLKNYSEEIFTNRSKDFYSEIFLAETYSC